MRKKKSLTLVTLNHRKIYNRLPIAWDGIPIIAISMAVTALLFILDWYLFAALMIVLTSFIIYFFRDPERSLIQDESAILTPADGKVLAIEHLQRGDKRYPEGAKKISIFMSLFNAHINRIPIKGRIRELSYHPGKFFSANMDKASIYNEHNIVTLETHNRATIIFVQIAGFIARRISCWVQEGDFVEAGQRFGLIRFGSRLEVYLPPQCTVIVTKGQKVRAGQTVLGYLGEIEDEKENKAQE
jgi:phosphatidylserine decarboxylase